MNDFILGLTIISVIWGIVSAIVMTVHVSRRGQKINILFFKLYVLKYIHQYRKITAEENGRPGIWYYSFIIAMNFALIIAILGILQ